MYPLVFNSSNIVQNGLNNTLRLNLGGNALNLSDMELAVASISQYNSVFNITAAYGNNSFTILIPYGSSGTPLTYTLNITLPDGSYEYSDINNYIQLQLINLGFYLIGPSGSYVYPISISANSNRYACEVDLFPVNTSLPTGYSYATSGFWSSASGLSPNAYTPQIVIPSTGFNTITGITAGTYPTSATTSTQTTILSQTTPQISPVQSYLLRCSLVNNIYNVVPDVLYSYNNQGTSIGQLISVQPAEYFWVDVSNQSTPDITLTICDQNYRPVALQDGNIVITLILKKKSV